jgi:hypothetical protein
MGCRGAHSGLIAFGEGPDLLAPAQVRHLPTCFWVMQVTPNPQIAGHLSTETPIGCSKSNYFLKTVLLL